MSLWLDQAVANRWGVEGKGPALNKAVTWIYKWPPQSKGLSIMEEPIQ